MSAATLLVLGAILTGGPATAELFRVTASGTVSSVSSQLGNEVQVGDPASLVYRFESETADRDPDPARGDYRAIKSFFVRVGSYTATSEDGEITVDDGFVAPPADRYLAESGTEHDISGPDLNGIPLQFAFLQLDDRTGNAFVDDSLPLELDLSDFDEGSIRVRFGAEREQVVADVQALTVPEASSPGLLQAALYTLGLLGAGRARSLARQRSAPARRGLVSALHH